MRRVLVVDDSQATREFIGGSVEDFVADSEVDYASSGLEALKLIPGGDYALIFTDINMPDINGLELIRFIRANPLFKEVPVIVISTEATAADRDRAMQLGGTDYLTKPVTTDQVTSTCRKYLPA